MSETSPIYSPPPALLSTAELAVMADALAGERQSCADEPATPLGYWPTAVAALLGHAAVLAMRLDSALWATDDMESENALMLREVQTLRNANFRMEKRAEALLKEQDRELEYERQMRQQTEEAMMKLGRRVMEQQAELAEQETEKMLLIRELTLAVGFTPPAAVSVR